MRAVDEPLGTSTKVSCAGPKGARTAHAPTPAVSRMTARTVRMMGAALGFFFFLLLRLRPTILRLSTLPLLKTHESHGWVHFL